MSIQKCGLHFSFLQNDIKKYNNPGSTSSLLETSPIQSRMMKKNPSAIRNFRYTKKQRTFAVGNLVRRAISCECLECGGKINKNQILFKVIDELSPQKLQRHAQPLCYKKTRGSFRIDGQFSHSFNLRSVRFSLHNNQANNMLDSSKMKSSTKTVSKLKKVNSIIQKLIAISSPKTFVNQNKATLNIPSSPINYGVYLKNVQNGGLTTKSYQGKDILTFSQVVQMEPINLKWADTSNLPTIQDNKSPPQSRRIKTESNNHPEQNNYYLARRSFNISDRIKPIQRLSVAVSPTSNLQLGKAYLSPNAGNVSLRMKSTYLRPKKQKLKQ